MSVITDFHSHILPGIDDGSSSLAESIEMLRMEAQQGIRHVIATPHFYARYDDPKQFLINRRKAELRLREALEKEPGLPEVTVGAEVHFFSGMSHSDLLPYLTIGPKSCILIEMPDSPWTDSMYRELENISARQGLVPIVAHVDRYIAPFRTHQIPQRLEELPVLVQANANFFLRSNTRSLAMKMLKKNQIQLLGSDCHNLTTRQPNLGYAVEVIQRRLGPDVLDRIQHYQDQVLMDE